MSDGLKTTNGPAGGSKDAPMQTLEPSAAALETAGSMPLPLLLSIRQPEPCATNAAPLPRRFPVPSTQTNPAVSGSTVNAVPQHSQPEPGATDVPSPDATRGFRSHPPGPTLRFLLPMRSSSCRRSLQLDLVKLHVIVIKDNPSLTPRLRTERKEEGIWRMKSIRSSSQGASFRFLP